MNNQELNLMVERWNDFEKIITLKLAEANCFENPFNNDELNWTTVIPGAYILLHPKTNEVYIGSTHNLYERKYKHLWHIRRGDHRNLKIRKAYKDNPTSNVYFFSFPTKDREAAFDLEQQFLDQYIGNTKFLNTALNARIAGTGIVKSPEVLKYMSVLMKEKWKDPEHYKLKSEITKAQWSNPEAKRKMIEHLKIKCSNPVYRSKQSENAKRQWASKEARDEKSRLTKLFRSNPENSKRYEKAYEARAIPVSIDGKIYKSYKEASQKLNLPIPTISGRLISKHRPTWFKINSNKENI